MKKLSFLFIFLFFLIFISLFIGENLGSFSDLFKNDSQGSFLFWNLRIPRMISALIAGSSLGLCGHIMQTYFQNPLAGPYVLGVHSGSTLMIALSIIGLGTNFIGNGDFSIIFFSILGPLIIMLLLFFLSGRNQNHVGLLIFGILLNYVISGILDLLFSVSENYQIKEFFLWNLGSFSRTYEYSLLLFFIIVFIAHLFALFIANELDLLLLGPSYARATGVSLKMIKWKVLIIVSLLTGAVVTFCGPLSFVGIISPHIFHKIFSTHLHRYSLLGSSLIGAILCLIANIFSQGFFLPTLPVNTVLSIMGGPLVGLYLIKNQKVLK